MQKTSTKLTQSDPNLMAELQSIILGLEPHELVRLQAWLRNKTNFAEEIGHILPLSIKNAIENNDQLGKSIEPIVEPLIYRQITQNPKAITNAIYPILGPIIRKHIAESFRKMIETVNTTLERQFSLKRLKWRIEALFTDLTFAEIVMLRGLPFRVKQVFLIHKETGLLIQQASIDGKNTNNSDMIASMLVAIQDFIKDSFSENIDNQETIEAIRLHNFHFWIEDSPLATLAVVFEGTPPEGIRSIFQKNLEKIQLHFLSELKHFNGEVLELPLLQSILDNCLIEQNQEIGYKKLVAFTSIIAIAILFLLIFNIVQYYKLENFAENLNSQAGIIITKTDKSFCNFYLEGLRDNNAVNPNKIAVEMGIDSNRVHYTWKDYISTDKAILIKRFTTKLQPPKTLNFHFADNTFFINGEAPHYWIIEARKFFNNNIFFPKVDMQNILDSDIAQLNHLKQKITAITFHFPRGIKELSEQNVTNLQKAASLFKQIIAIVPSANLKVILSLDNVDEISINKNYAIERLQRIKKIFEIEKLKNVTYIQEKYRSSLKPRTIIFEVTEE